MAKDNMADKLGAITKRKFKLGKRTLKHVKMYEEFSEEFELDEKKKKTETGGIPGDVGFSMSPQSDKKKKEDEEEDEEETTESED